MKDLKPETSGILKADADIPAAWTGMLQRLANYFRTEPVIAVSFALGISGNKTSG